MKRNLHYCIMLFVALLMFVFIHPFGASAMTYDEMINLSAQAREDYHTSVGAGEYRGAIPTINNSGHYAFTIGGKWAGGGHVYYSDGVIDPYNIGPYATYASGNFNFLRMNDNDLIGFSDTSGNNYVATPSAGTVHTFANAWYTPAINNNDRVAYLYSSGFFNPDVRYSDSPYSSEVNFSENGTDGAKFIDMNNSGQMVWSTQSGAGVVLDGVSLDSGIYGQPKIADTGDVLYLKGTSLYLHDGTIADEVASEVLGGYGVFLDISDNADHLVWTQEVDGNYDVFTLIDEVATNLTEDLFAGQHSCKFSDINNNGDIIFSEFYSQDVYLMTPSAVPIPSAAWLLGSGLIGVVGFRRKFLTKG